LNTSFTVISLGVTVYAPAGQKPQRR
jgi:hypothetical protein